MKTCNKCGQCCKMFCLPFTHEQIKAIRKQYRKTGTVTLPNGNKPIDKITEKWLAVHVKKNPVYGWRCNLLTNNQCPIHNHKPQPCRDFGNPGSTCTPYKECPFWYGDSKSLEKDYRDFLTALKNRR